MGTQSMKDEILSRGSDKNMISAKENADDVLNMLNDTKPPVKTISDNLSNIDIASLDLDDNTNKLSNFDFFPEKKNDDSSSNDSINLQGNKPNIEMNINEPPRIPTPPPKKKNDGRNSKRKT